MDGYFSSQQAVWHPDNLPLRLAWQGSGGPGEGQLLGGSRGSSGGSAGGEQAWLDPFAEVPDSLRVEAFTELLPEGARGLQWALPQYGERILVCGLHSLALGFETPRCTQFPVALHPCMCLQVGRLGPNAGTQRHSQLPAYT